MADDAKLLPSLSLSTKSHATTLNACGFQTYILSHLTLLEADNAHSKPHILHFTALLTNGVYSLHLLTRPRIARRVRQEARKCEDLSYIRIPSAHLMMLSGRPGHIEEACVQLYLRIQSHQHMSTAFSPRNKHIIVRLK
jgi:hypothetical protein